MPDDVMSRTPSSASSAGPAAAGPTRVRQLDAAELDSELAGIFRSQLDSVLRGIMVRPESSEWRRRGTEVHTRRAAQPRAPAQYGPELNAVIVLVIWWATLFRGAVSGRGALAAPGPLYALTLERVHCSRHRALRSSDCRTR